MFNLDLPSLPWITALAQSVGKAVSFMDLETTSPRITSSTFGITEVGVCSIRAEGAPLHFSQLIHPGFEIPPKVVKITGISDEMVATAPAFPFLEQRMRYVMEKTLVVGFNIRPYDMPGLCTQFRRYHLELPAPGVILDLRDIWMGLQKTNKGKLVEVAEYYGRPFTGAHRALSDVLGCVHLLEAMLERHGMDEVVSYMRGFPSIQAPEFPPESSAEEQGKQELQEQVKEKAKEVILQFVAEGEEWDLPFLVARGGLKDEFTASLAVQELMDEGLVRPDQIQLPAVRDWLALHWLEVLAASPERRLKPMLEKAKNLNAPPQTDYTQLRAALKQHELKLEKT